MLLRHRTMTTQQMGDAIMIVDHTAPVDVVCVWPRVIRTSVYHQTAQSVMQMCISIFVLAKVIYLVGVVQLSASVVNLVLMCNPSIGRKWRELVAMVTTVWSICPHFSIIVSAPLVNLVFDTVIGCYGDASFCVCLRWFTSSIAPFALWSYVLYASSGMRTDEHCERCVKRRGEALGSSHGYCTSYNWLITRLNTIIFSLVILCNVINILRDYRTIYELYWNGANFE